MSRDIRSFFTVISKKPNGTPKAEKPKKPVALIDSDDNDEDVVKSTPDKGHKVSRHKRRAIALSSDSEDEKSPTKTSSDKKRKILTGNQPKKEEKSKLRPINFDLLNRPINQSEVKYIPKEDTIKKEEDRKVKHKKHRKKDKNVELEVHADKDFQKTLQILDEDPDDTVLLDNLDVLDKTIESAVLSEQVSEVKPEDSNKPNTATNLQESKIKGHKSSSESELKHKKKDEKSQNDTSTSKKAEKRPRKHSESTPTPKKKQKMEQTDSGIVEDLEKWEKKRQSASSFVAYLHRPGPKHHGEKEYPKGKPDCLRGLTFLRTGVLDSLDGEEFENLVKDHGGRVVHSVSRKVNYLVVGDEPGPAKLDKAKKYNLTQFSEDQFLDLILEKSGMKPKYATSADSDDLGFEGSEENSEKDEIACSTVQEDGGSKLSETEINEITSIEEKSEIKSGGVPVDRHVRHCTMQVKNKPLDPQNNESVISKELVFSQSSKSLGSTKSPDSQSTSESQNNKSDASKDPLVSQSMESNISKKTLNSQSIESSPPSQKLQPVLTENLPWTDKYKPTSIKSIIGQQDGNSNMNKLQRWLENWFRNSDPERRKKLPKPTLYNQFDGAYFKAALLSGPPGVGKTTTATLVAKELGFDIVEFNASDTRNKKLLHEEISHMMKSKTVAGFASGQKNMNQKRLLLMDEVDGMAGNEDRGGIAELINFIKSANFPIVCMCNNRDLPKMRTLVNHCYSLKFGKPNVAQVRGAMMSICFKEGLTIKPEALAQLIAGTGSDIRQTLNHLSMWSAAEKSLSAETVQRESTNSKKDVVFGVWDVIRMVFNKIENQHMTLADKSRLFFYDYSFGPMFVQENYLTVEPECTSPKLNKSLETLIRRHLTADCLSRSDLIESKIRSTNNWSLLETQAYFSTVLPSHYLSGKMGPVRFPGWFGKNSQRNKSLRIMGELYSHSRTSISGDKISVRLDYAEPLLERLLTPLTEKQAAGIDDTLEIMKSYTLLRDDLTNLCELMTSFSNKNRNPFDRVSSSVKSALTRKYNKTMVLSFAPPAASKKKKGSGEELEGLLDEEDEQWEEEEKDDDNIDSDVLVKVKNKSSAQPGMSKSSGSQKESKSKGKTSKSSSIKSGKGKRKK